MKTKLARTSAIAFSALLIIGAVAIFAPSATAQAGNQTISLTIKVNEDKNLPNGRLLPETSTATLKVDATLTFNQGGGCLKSVVVEFTPKGIEPYSSAVFNPSSVTIAIATGTEPPVASSTPIVKTATSDLIISTKRDAPAFADGQYNVEVKATAGEVTSGTCNYTPATAQGRGLVKNDYLPLTMLNPSSLYIKAGQNKKVVFPVEVQNLGNGPTRIKMEALQTSKNKLDSINTGAELRLESRAGKGASAQFKSARNIEVQTPHSNGYSNSIYSFNVKVTSTFDGAAQGTLQQDEQTLTFSVQVQGVYVPGFDPVSVLAAVGIGLLAFTRIMRRS